MTPLARLIITPNELRKLRKLYFGMEPQDKPTVADCSQCGAPLNENLMGGYRLRDDSKPATVAIEICKRSPDYSNGFILGQLWQRVNVGDKTAFAESIPLALIGDVLNILEEAGWHADQWVTLNFEKNV